jgi:hypothetical protein
MPRLQRGVTAALIVLSAVTGAVAAPLREDQALIMGNVSGTQQIAQDGGTARAEYSFNDRGRGDHIVATWKLDASEQDLWGVHRQFMREAL